MNANRQKLIDALRSEMPPKFSWDFSVVLEEDYPCGTAGCALGLATLIFPEALTRWNKSDSYELIDIDEDLEVMDFLGIEDHETYLNIFYRSTYYKALNSSHVTPAMVADALEALP